MSGPNFKFIPRAGSTKLIIFFSGTGKNNGKFDFWNVGRDIPENILFVSDGRNYWYQEGVPGLGTTIDETAGTLAEWCKFLGVDEITTVGASMGGYGAILFAALLGGKALAFSFDSILRLPTSPSEKHMPAEAPVHYPDIVPIIEKTGTRIHVYAGEMYPMDLVGALRLKHLPTVTIDTLRGVDHASARFVHQVAGLKNVVADFANGAPLPRLREVGTILENPQLVDLLHQAHLCFARKDYIGCVKTGREALALDPNLEANHYLLGKAYLQRRKTQHAIRHLSLVAACLPDFEDGQFLFAHALRLAKSNYAAEDLLSRQTIKWPKSSKVYYNLAKAQEAIGASTDAIRTMEMTVALEPHYQPRLVEMTARIQELVETETRPLNDLPAAIAGRPHKKIPAAKPKSKHKPKKKKPTFYGRLRKLWRQVAVKIPGRGMK